MIGTSGTSVTRKGLGRSGAVRRNTQTPMQTRMNAKRVPMFVRSAKSPMSTNIATPPTTMPVQIVVTQGVRNFG